MGVRDLVERSASACIPVPGWPASPGRQSRVGRVRSPEDAVFSDLDVMSCEEVANLGVFWYENPRK
jgi:hypothetical protein